MKMVIRDKDDMHHHHHNNNNCSSNTTIVASYYSIWCVCYQKMRLRVLQCDVSPRESARPWIYEHIVLTSFPISSSQQIGNICWIHC